MITAIVQCPNPACGRVSCLGQDPLGRIFRCPHCLRKLPAAPANAGDAGWTAILGRPRFGRGLRPFQVVQVPRWADYEANGRANLRHDWMSLSCESGQVVIERLDEAPRSNYVDGCQFPGDLGPGDSSEVLIFPALSESQSNPACMAVSRSSMSAVVGDESISKLFGSHLALGENGELGRFRVLSVLGEGEHAVVYRAYDPILERDVALKVPRQGVLKTVKAVDRFLGEAKALAKLTASSSCAGVRGRVRGCMPLYRHGTH